MINILHLLAIIVGVLAYYFSDVNSNSGFTNTLLPFIVMLSFIYGVIVTVSMLYNLRNKSDMTDKSADILFQSMKELAKKEPVAKNTASGDTSAASAKSNKPESN